MLRQDGALSHVPSLPSRPKFNDSRAALSSRTDKGIHYRALYPFKPPHEAYLADLETDTTRSLLTTYFQLDPPLEPLYADWSTRDPKFDRKIKREKERLGGIRVLRQNEWETLVS